MCSPDTWARDETRTAVGDRIPKGEGVSPRSRGRTVLARVWKPLVAVVALSLGAVLMWKVHEFSAPLPVTTVLGPQAVPEFSPKQVVYELSGSIGTGGMLVWAGGDGHPPRGDFTNLPWSR